MRGPTVEEKAKGDEQRERHNEGEAVLGDAFASVCRRTARVTDVRGRGRGGMHRLEWDKEDIAASRPTSADVLDVHLEDFCFCFLRARATTRKPHRPNSGPGALVGAWVDLVFAAPAVRAILQGTRDLEAKDEANAEGKVVEGCAAEALVVGVFEDEAERRKNEVHDAVLEAAWTQRSCQSWVKDVKVLVAYPPTKK